MFQNMLISFAKEIVFEALIQVLRQEAKKSDTPIDDNLVDYLEQSKSVLFNAMTKVF